MRIKRKTKNNPFPDTLNDLLSFCLLVLILSFEEIQLIKGEKYAFNGKSM
jgi:hypothetical protein